MIFSDSDLTREEATCRTLNGLCNITWLRYGKDRACTIFLEEHSFMFVIKRISNKIAFAKIKLKVTITYLEIFKVTHTICCTNTYILKEPIGC